MPARFRLVVAMSMVVVSLTAAPSFAQSEISISSWVPQSHFLDSDFLAGWAQEVEKLEAGKQG